MGIIKKVVFLLFFSCSQSFCATAVTYHQAAGRLGDQLITYCLAKYISFKYGLDFYIRSFSGYSQLAFSTVDPLYNETKLRGLEKIYIRNEADFLQRYNAQKNQLFIISDSHWETSSPDSEWYGVSHSKEFRALMRKLIAPINAIPKLQLPHDHITVALHYRVGETFDDAAFIKIQQDENNTNPKFRPFGYYVEQIKYVKRAFPDQKIYVHIFTDAANPAQVRTRFKKVFPEESICFAAREGYDSWRNNVLVDLVHMAQFECLIRPRSCYSFISQLIGFHKLVLHPQGALWINQ